MQPNDPA